MRQHRVTPALFGRVHSTATLHAVSALHRDRPGSATAAGAAGMMQAIDRYTKGTSKEREYAGSGQRVASLDTGIFQQFHHKRR